jgi:werner syndrome-like exonuclease
MTMLQLDKRNSVRLGNWEDVLSKKQLQYAATDAFASWHLFKVGLSFSFPFKGANYCMNFY